MKMRVSAVFLAMGILFVGMPHLVASASCCALEVPARSPSTMLAGRKTVTVYADNESAAMVEAERKNKGWKAVSARKASKDKKSRMYQGTMEQGK